MAVQEHGTDDSSRAAIVSEQGVLDFGHCAYDYGTYLWEVACFPYLRTS
jgi:hypothetical protein